MSVVAALQHHRLIPVIAIPDAEQAQPLCQALMAGGLPIAEITFRTAAAVDAIRAAAQIPGMIVGAGTVLNIAQAQAASEAGAQFLVSPGFSAEVVAWSCERNMPIFPGVATPSEVMAALAMGLKYIKLFPAESLGGVAYLKALAAPFKEVKFIPTGGIGLNLLADYLAQPSVLAVGGSWMVPAEALKNRDYATIQRLTSEATKSKA